ncbi:MAG: trehalose-phosphatase [Phycisphaerae bacterium]|nr:trehalose-phosphatase [Phycisphaerae bacterium]
MDFRRPWKAAILDMDGVITRTASVHARAWKRMFDEFLAKRGDGESRQPPFDMDSDYRRYVDGKPRYDGVQSFLEARGIELPWGNPQDSTGTNSICGLGNRKNHIFQEVIKETGVDVFEDAVEQIDYWKANGVKVAVFSSSRNCRLVLEAANLIDKFDARVDGEDLKRRNLRGKPAPDMLVEAARELDADPADTIVLEDAISGVQAGRSGNFGMVVGVAREKGAEEDLRSAGAHCIVSDLREIRMTPFCPPGENCLLRPSSASDHATWIVECIGQRKPAMFLDYDGTLTPIVRRPEDATLGENMRSILVQWAQHANVAIVSGRDRQDVQSLVRLPQLCYAGSHGFDIRGPNGLQMQQEEAVSALPALDEAERNLREVVSAIDGARVERKKFAIAVHFREVSSENDIRQIETSVDQIVSRAQHLRKRSGKKIFELQPDVEWDKGHAILWLIKAMNVSDRANVVFYIGDDVTDEDAFRALRRQGRGVGIRVGSPDEDTLALFYLRNCDEVAAFLETLLRKFRESDSSHG